MLLVYVGQCSLCSRFQLLTAFRETCLVLLGRIFSTLVHVFHVACIKRRVYQELHLGAKWFSSEI